MGARKFRPRDNGGRSSTNFLVYQWAFAVKLRAQDQVPLRPLPLRFGPYTIKDYPTIYKEFSVQFCPGSLLLGDSPVNVSFPPAGSLRRGNHSYSRPASLGVKY